MEGTIKMYNESKGYGFIRTQGDDVFFHIKSFVDSNVIPSLGMKLKFGVKEGVKGPEAINIEIDEHIRKTFIKVGDARIKLSNIKDYGIADGSEELLARIEALNVSINKNKDDIEDYKKYSPTYDRLIKDKQKENDEFTKKIGEIKCSIEYELASKRTLEYLYITTYQDDNFRFYAHKAVFDIHQKIDELDEALC